MNYGSSRLAWRLFAACGVCVCVVAGHVNAWQPEHMPGYYYIVGTDGGAVYPGRFRPNSNGWYATSMNSNLGATFGHYGPGELPVSASLAGRAPGRFAPSTYANSNMVYDVALTNGLPLESSGAGDGGERWNEKWVFVRARGITNLNKFRWEQQGLDLSISANAMAYQEWRLSDLDSWRESGLWYWDATNKAWLGGVVNGWAVAAGFWVTDTNLATGFDVSGLHVATSFQWDYLTNSCVVSTSQLHGWVWECDPTPCHWVQYPVLTIPTGGGDPYYSNYPPVTSTSCTSSRVYFESAMTNYVSEGNVAFYIGSRRVVSGALAGYKLRFNAWGH